MDEQSPLIVDLLTTPLSQEFVLELLHEVIDPELGVNIVDLGLVYDALIEDGAVEVRMTLTTPACPLGGYMEDNIKRVLSTLPQVRRVAVDIVWDPLWDPSMMTDVAREQLGWLSG